MTLSLSSQLVTYKQKHQKLESENELLNKKVGTLEKQVVSLGGVIPDYEAMFDEQNTNASEDKVLEEATKAISTSAENKPKLKGVLI